MLSEISQTEKDKYCMIPHMLNRKNTTNYWVKQKRNRLRYREQTSGYQWGEGHEGRGLRGANYYVPNELQGYIIQHREYSQHFIITINELQPLKIVNYYMVYL